MAHGGGRWHSALGRAGPGGKEPQTDAGQLYSPAVWGWGGHDSSSHWPDYRRAVWGGGCPTLQSGDITPSLSWLLAPCLLDSPLLLAEIRGVTAGWGWARGPRLWA